MTIQLIGRPEFLGVPDDYRPGRDVDSDQFTGTQGEQLAELAARVCYDSVYNGRDSESHQTNIKKTKHWNVVRCANYVFLCTDISRPLAMELIRHHVGTAISMRSTRYVDEGVAKIVTHPLIARTELDFATRYAMDKAEQQSTLAYLSLVEALQAQGVREGMSRRQARKQARGAARFYLPMGIATEFVWTANMEAIMNVVSKRDSKHADEEIQSFAQELHGILKVEAPRFFKELDYE